MNKKMGAEHLTTMLGHIAIMVVAICNLLVVLKTQRDMKAVKKQVNGEE